MKDPEDGTLLRQLDVYMDEMRRKPMRYDNCTHICWLGNPTRLGFIHDDASIQIMADQIIAVSVRDQPASPQDHTQSLSGEHENLTPKP